MNGLCFVLAALVRLAHVKSKILHTNPERLRVGRSKRAQNTKSCNRTEYDGSFEGHACRATFRKSYHDPLESTENSSSEHEQDYT
jgi:hypothetical protein